ncbi:unnamed protein product [Urochloa humidicola]
MSFVLRKSSPTVVRPPAPEMTKCDDISLSPFDMGLDSAPATFFLMFDHPIHKPAETIKMALSQALVHYYPFAGRLSPGTNDGELCIRGTADGALFVSASADRTLKEAKFFDQSSRATTILRELCMDYSASGCSHSDPLLLMQVTEFSCGGFIVGVTWNHAVADGIGMAQFLQAIGEFARGLSAPSVVPVRCGDSMPRLPALVATGRRFMMNLEPQDFTSLDVTIPMSLINRIRAEFHGHSDGQSCTVFEVVTAVLWQCRTRATMSNQESPSLLYFVVNVRKHVAAKEGYYGNCVIGQLIMATSGAVANGSIMNIIEMIQQAKEKTPDQLREKDGGENSLPMGVSPEQLSDVIRYSYNLLTISSMHNLGLEEVDFGCGMPARVMCHSPMMSLPACVPCLPWKKTDGANVLARCVKEEHTDAFLGELAKFI